MAGASVAAAPDGHGPNDDDDDGVPASRLFQLRMSDRFAVLRSPMGARGKAESRVVRVGSLPVKVSVTCSGNAGGNADASPRAPARFVLEYSGYACQGSTVSLRLTWNNGSLELLRSEYLSGDGHATRLTLLSSSPREKSASLTVTELGGRGGPSTDVNLCERDLLSLLRKHPTEVAALVRPALHELGQDALFAPDPKVTWQVFADRWTARRELVEQVEAHLPALDADEWRTRERATKRLRELGPEVAIAVGRVDRSGLSAEQNCRLDAVVAAHFTLTGGERRRLRGDVPFLLVCLYADDHDVRAAAVERLVWLLNRQLVGLSVTKMSDAEWDDAVEALRGRLGK
jgi:hypothetical protein